MDKKSIRGKGKLSLSKYFHKFEEGDSVAVVKEESVTSAFPLKMQGRTGKVEKKVGSAYLVKIKDQDKEKKFLIHPIHLREIKLIKSKEK